MTLVAEPLCVAVKEALRPAGNGNRRHSFGVPQLRAVEADFPMPKQKQLLV